MPAIPGRVPFWQPARTVVVVECTGHSGEPIAGPEARLGFIGDPLSEPTLFLTRPNCALPAEMQVPLPQVQGSRSPQFFPLAVTASLAAVLPRRIWLSQPQCPESISPISMDRKCHLLSTCLLTPQRCRNSCPTTEDSSVANDHRSHPRRY